MELPELKGRLEQNYPLRKLNTWKIGGPGELVFWPESIEDLAAAVKWCRRIGQPVFLLGRGSNVLLPDEGLKGLIIVSADLDGISWKWGLVTGEAGYSLRRLAVEAAARGLSGLEFASGIPGTLGAATANNAGAHGQAIGQLVERVKVLTPEGKILSQEKGEIQFAYRQSSLQENNFLVLESSLRLVPGKDTAAIKKVMEDLKVKRRITQPLEYPNAGSVFRNPQGDSAGRLIELAGWKGQRLGDAQVSEKHANFIVNRGKARAQEVLSLIEAIQHDVNSKFGVMLETEVRIIRKDS